MRRSSPGRYVPKLALMLGNRDVKRIVGPVETYVRGRVRCLRGEDGIALIMAVLVLAIMMIVGTAVIQYSSSNSRSASLSKESSSAYTIAEAGVAEAMAVLNDPANNPLNPYLLPSTTSGYAGGTVTWSGAMDLLTGTWTITSFGHVKNPTGPAAADIQRKVVAVVDITQVVSKSTSNPLWNYIYANKTGDADGCDLEIRNTSDIYVPVYSEGNLCIGQTTKILKGPLVTKGRLMLENPQNGVGSNGSPISEAHIANGCQYKNKPLNNPCQGPPDNVYATVLDSVPFPVSPPVPDWDAAYLNGSPGPYYPCAAVSGTPPPFDNDQGSPLTPNPALRNDSLPAVVDLTPGASYTCQTAGGELSWNAATNVLTARGLIFIDGNAEVQSGGRVEYNGQAVIYLSGTLLIKNTEFCAAISGSSCDFTNWDPNTELLIFVANGNGGGQVPAGVSVQLKSATFQGGLMATYNIELDTFSRSHGPLLAETEIIGQTVGSGFPNINILPSGAPGDPVKYAYPNPPTIYG